LSSKEFVHENTYEISMTIANNEESFTT